MPELPDVQVFKEYLDATGLHQTIQSVQIRREEILADISRRTLQRRLTGHAVRSTRRHGKYLFAEVDEAGWLVLHFGMTGYLEYSETQEPPEHTRLLLQFENGAHLAYVCQRLLGTVAWTEDPQTFIDGHELGIDGQSDELDLAAFEERIGGKRGTIKSALMDQETIAGLGNVYVDEILFQARVHPKTPCSDLDRKALKALHRQMQRVITAAVRARVQTDKMPKSFLLPQRGRDEPHCPRCDAPLKTLKVSGRTSYICPKCQQPPH